MNQFIEIKKGLKEEHLNINPLFEKVYTPPGYGEDMISRLYSDGSLYYLIDNEDVSEETIVNDIWGYVSKIQSEGVELISNLLEKCCETIFVQKEEGNLPGTIKWKFFCGDKIKEVVIRGLPVEDEKLFSEIDKLVSTRIEKV